MGWLYAQTWLWYLIAFVVGVLLARLLFGGARADRAAEADPVADGRTGDDRRVPVPAAAVGGARAEAGTGGHDDAVTEQFPAVDPALATLDVSRGAAGLGTAGLATGALGAAGAADATQVIPRVDAEPETTRIPVVPPLDAGSGEETARIPVVAPEAPAADAADGAPATATEAEAGSSVDPTTPAGTPLTDTPQVGAEAADTEAADTEAADTEAADDAAPDAAPASAADDSAADDSAADDTPTAAGAAGAAAAAEPAVVPGRFPGSALPLQDGAPPTPEHTIKGNGQSMLYHTPKSPYYSRTKAEVWFTSTADAEAAGFADIRSRRR